MQEVGTDRKSAPMWYVVVEHVETTVNFERNKK